MTITLKIYKNSPEHREYMNARFPKDRRHHSCSNETFEFKGHRWKYQVTSFDDNGDYDLLWRPDGKEPELMASDATIRDYFAKAAMQSLITHFDYGCIGFDERYMNEFAKEAYQIADAMLKARG